MRPTVTVLAPGALATVQDDGRVGSAHLGVPRSGAADRSSHHLANRLVGNAASAATIEVLLGGFTCVLGAGRWCAVAGADSAVTVDHRAVSSRASFYVPAGAQVSLGPARSGLRSYLAVAGGVRGETQLGSASWDSLSRLGTPPAEVGTCWALGPPDASPPGVELDLVVDAPTTVTVVFDWGPRHALLSAAARHAVTRTRWSVSADTDRVGTRLVGEPIALREGSLPSEGCLRGAVQLPPSGQPIVFGADHPATGGYPVVGVVDPAGCDLLAQSRPGTTVRLQPRPAHRR